MAALAATLLVTGCSKKKEAEAEPVIPVQLTPVSTGSIERIITAEGILRAKDQSAVMPKISAPVSRFYVNRGDHVRKGQLLAVLENRDLAAGVVDTRGSYEQANASYRNVARATVPDEIVKSQADVQSSKQAMDAAKVVVDSRTKLFQEGALAKKLVDDANVAYVQARSTYETAQKHLESVQNVGRTEEVKTAAGQAESARGKLEAAQAQLSYSEIRSPISGVVADRAVFPGEMAASGSAVITVMDVSSVIARVNMPQAQAAFLRVGQTAGVAATDSPDEVTGKVTVVSPAVDPQSTTVEVWIQAPNPGEHLRPGGTVHVTVHAGVVQGALLVPAVALLPSQEGGTAVMEVGADNVAHERKVELGVRNGDKVQIASGIKAGANVVTSGGVGLQDGAKVEVKKAGEEDKDDKDEKKSPRRRQEGR